MGESVRRWRREAVFEITADRGCVAALVLASHGSEITLAAVSASDRIAVAQGCRATARGCSNLAIRVVSRDHHCPCCSPVTATKIVNVVYGGLGSVSGSTTGRAIVVVAVLYGSRPEKE